MEIVTRAWGPQHPQLAYALLNLSSLEKKTGDYQAALDASRRAGEILIASFGPDHPIYAYAANNTGVFTGRIRSRNSGKPQEPCVRPHRWRNESTGSSRAMIARITFIHDGRKTSSEITEHPNTRTSEKLR